jgi:hypothetical protein
VSVDGIQLHLNRSAPFTYYEEPVIRNFREKYGEDARRVPENDPRWQAHCAGYVTQYLSEIRKRVDEKRGRELGVTVFAQRTRPTRRTILTPNITAVMSRHGCGSA